MSLSLEGIQHANHSSTYLNTSPKTSPLQCVRLTNLLPPPTLITYLNCSDRIRLVAQSCPTLCDPMNCSTLGLPVHQQLLEFSQTHIHRVSDAIQPSHPLSSPSLLPPIPPSIRVFSNESTLRMRWPKYWSFRFSIIPSNTYPLFLDFLPI